MQAGFDGLDALHRSTRTARPAARGLPVAGVGHRAGGHRARRRRASPPTTPPSSGRRDWLLGEEIRVAGDWAVRRPELAPGGWAFEFDNDNYPDIDDTGRGRAGAARVARPETGASTAAVGRGVAWARGHAVHATAAGARSTSTTPATLCRRLPFCDFGEVIDPPQRRRHRPRRRDARRRARADRGALPGRPAWLLDAAGGRRLVVRAVGRQPRLRHRAPPCPRSSPRAPTATTAPSGERSAGSSRTRTPTAAGARTCARTATPTGAGAATRPRRRPRGRCWRCSRPATRGRPPGGASRWLVETQRPDGTWDEPLVHRHRLPRRLLHQLPPVPAGVPGDGPRAATCRGNGSGARERARWSWHRCGIEARASRGGASTATVAARAWGAGAAAGRPQRLRLAAGTPPVGAVAVAGFCGAVDRELRPGTSWWPRGARPRRSAPRRLPRRRAARRRARAAPGCRPSSGPLRSVERLVRGSRPRGARRRRRGRRRHGVGVAARAQSAPTPCPQLSSCAPSPTPRPRAAVAGTLPVHAWRGRPFAAHRRPGPRAWAAATRPPACCWPRPVASAPASSGPSTSSSGRSTRFGPAGLRASPDRPQHPRGRRPRRAGARCSSRSSTRCPTASHVVFAAHGVAPAVREDAERRGLRHHRRDLPARRQGPPRGPAVRGDGLRRSCSSATPSTRRWRAPSGEAPEAIMVVEDAEAVDARCRSPTPSAGRLPDPDHAGGRRDGRGRRPRCASASRPRRAPRRRHLLRDAEPAGGRPRASPPSATSCSWSARPTRPTRNRLVEVAERRGCAARLLDDDAGLELA